MHEGLGYGRQDLKQGRKTIDRMFARVTQLSVIKIYFKESQIHYVQREGGGESGWQSCEERRGNSQSEESVVVSDVVEIVWVGGAAADRLR